MTDSLDVRPGQLWRWTHADSGTWYVVLMLRPADDIDNVTWSADDWVGCFCTACPIGDAIDVDPNMPFVMRAKLDRGHWSLEQDVGA